MSGKSYSQSQIDLLYLVDFHRDPDIYDELASELGRTRDAIDFCLRWRDNPESFPSGANNKIRRQFEDARDRIGREFEATMSPSAARAFLSEPQPAAHRRAALLAATQSRLEAAAYFEDRDLEVGIQRVLQSVIQRRGQSEFRNKLMVAYDGRCAISGWEGDAALEAAHIVPYAKSGQTDAKNGLLLRADLHTLFDQGLITIDPIDCTIHVSVPLRKTEYGEFDCKLLRLPPEENTRPSLALLKWHREYWMEP